MSDDDAKPQRKSRKRRSGTSLPAASSERKDIAPDKERSLEKWPGIKRILAKESNRSTLALFIASVAVILNGFLVYITGAQYLEYKKSIRSELRAYVACAKSEFGVSFFNPPEISKIQIRNFGHTPALNCRIKYQLKAFHGEFPDDPPFDSPIDSLDNLQIIGGGGETWMEFSPFKNLPDTLSEKMKAREIGMYLYGIVRYEDIFNQNHFLRFCYKLDPTPGATRFFMYRKYNREENEPDVRNL